MIEAAGVEKILFLQFLTLSLYVFFVGFTFCDGFKLPVVLKLFWFVPFLLISVYVFKAQGQFTLYLILPLSTLWAFLLCFKQRSRKKD